MIVDLAHYVPPFLTAFLASLVECIEALTVVLAVEAVLGWRGALIGTGLALGALLGIVVILGPMLTLVPSEVIHLGVGTLLLIFGARWLRKAVLRAAGAIPMRDEPAAYARNSNRLRALGAGHGHMGLLAAFQITMVEGFEVVFIVVAIGAAGRDLIVPASLGAFAALLVVPALGLALHRPIARVPENALKFTVGVLTCAFGIFWIGQGIGINWPGEDWSVLALAVGILAAALVAIRLKEPKILPTL